MQKAEIKAGKNSDGIYRAPWEKPAAKILTPFERFLHNQSASSFLLFSAMIIALLLANSAFSTFYHDLTHTKLGFTLGNWSLKMSLHHWVNDGLMAIFFFVVGMELKRELMIGELANIKKAALPVIAAIGGMVFPALIYAYFNHDGIGANGWGIPMATDIAFAVGVMILLGKRAPAALMAFLVALAIADDLGAVLVIAVFYTETIVYPALFAAIALSMALFVLNLSGVRSPYPYFMIAVLLWFAMLHSGIHATLAGVIGAFSIPVKPKFNPQYFSDRTKGLLDKFDDSVDDDERHLVNNSQSRAIIQKMEEHVRSVMSPLQRLEYIWHLPVAFFVIPVFALFNAGVHINQDIFLNLFKSPIALGVILGLIFGKIIGITLLSWLAVKLKIAQLPTNTTFAHIFGASMLAGIGFTMSIFVAQLSFAQQQEVLNLAKTGVLFASLVAGTGGFLWLWFVGRNNQDESE